MDQENDFYKWNNLKKETSRKSFPQFNVREIWYCSLGQNIGREENGKHASFERPVLILKKFNQEVFFGLPLSSMNKNLPFYYLLDYHEISSVLLSQIRVLDSKRLLRKIRTISKDEFEKIRVKFKQLI